VHNTENTMHKHTSLFIKYVFSKLKKILSLIYKTFNWLWEKSRQRKRERERKIERSCIRQQQGEYKQLPLRYSHPWKISPVH